MNSSIDLDQATSRLGLRTATWLLFGDELSVERANELAHHQREVLRWLGERISSPAAVIPYDLRTSTRGLRKHRKAFDAYISGLIERRRHVDSSNDVLSVLIEAQPKGRLLTDAELCGHIAGFIGAGNEVTASTLSWALVYAAQNPNEFAALRDSPDKVRKLRARNHRTSLLIGMVDYTSTGPHHKAQVG